MMLSVLDLTAVYQSLLAVAVGETWIFLLSPWKTTAYDHFRLYFLFIVQCAVRKYTLSSLRVLSVLRAVGLSWLFGAIFAVLYGRKFSTRIFGKIREKYQKSQVWFGKNLDVNIQNGATAINRIVGN